MTKNLLYLDFGELFNENIDDIFSQNTLPKLKTLKFGYEFNKKIDSLKYLSDSLEQLYFGYKFNEDINPIKNLKKLELLSLSYEFNQRDIILDLHTQGYLQNLKKLFLEGIHSNDNENLIIYRDELDYYYNEYKIPNVNIEYHYSIKCTLLNNIK